MLVSTDWVAEHADDPAYRLVEVDEDTTAYAGGHIRNAVAWHWKDDLHEELRREFLGQEALAELLARSGVGPDTTVVLYGGNNNWFATYAYWLLRYLGFDRVKLMDGGRKKWELEERELVTEEPSVARADPGALAPVRHELRAFRDDVLGHIDGAASRWWTCAARPSSRARCWRRPTCPRSRPRCRGTSRARPTSPGRRPPARTAASRATTS